LQLLSRLTVGAEGEVQMRTKLMLVLLLTACGAGIPFVGTSVLSPPSTNTGVGVGGGEVGATTGGQKDIGQARAAVAAGHVPSPGMIVTEGLLSEHDFPTEGGPCTERFCARPAAARFKSLATGQDELFVHVGMAANLGANWKRPPADIVVVIDKGSSMAIDLAEVVTAVSVLIDKLEPDDRFGVVVFDDTARKLIPLGPLTDKAAAKTKLAALTAAGGFQVIDGIELGYAEADLARTEGRLSRVMLFTCGYPPAGKGPFADAVKKYAARGVGLSLFGVLLGFDPGMGRLMSTEYGGNFHYLQGLDDVTKVFDTDLDFLITPLAYDFKLELLPAPLVTVAKAWGIPGDSLKLEATTIFPSRNRGAIVLRLAAPTGTLPEESGAFEFRYATTIGGTPVATNSPLLPATGNGVRKAAALVNMADELVTATTLWGEGKHADAKAKVDALLVYLTAEALALSDPQLEKEVQFVASLRANMK
jgi:Ca-activated chloride channel family protein